MDEWEAEHEWEAERGLLFQRPEQLPDLRTPDRSSCEVLMCTFRSPPNMDPIMCLQGNPEDGYDACAGTIKVSSESDTDSVSDSESDADSELLERLDAGLKRLAANLARRGVEMDPHDMRRNIDEQIASRRRPRPRRSETQEEAETQELPEEERGRARARTPSTKRRLRSTRRRLRSQGRAKAVAKA